MKYSFKTKPYPHQVRALRFLLERKGGGLQVPMRWGKSKVGIDFAGCMYLKHNVHRVLVVTVTSGLGVWQDQIEEHCPLLWRVLDHHGEVLAEHPGIQGGLADTGIPILDFMLVNFQNTYVRAKMGPREWVPVENKTLVKFNAHLVIIDESHHIGNPTAVTSVNVQKLGRRARYRVIMTGSMFHRRPFYIFGQAKFYDDGARLGSSFTQYKKRIAVFGGYQNYEVKKYRNFQWVMKLMKEFVYMEKYVPPGKPVVNLLRFNLEGPNLTYYMEMLKEKVIKVKGQTIMGEMVLTHHLRLHQIAGGFVKLPEGGYAQVGTCKSEMLADRLAEYREQGIDKAVVGCRFIPELREVARVGKKLGYRIILFHGGVPKGRERTRRISAFRDSKVPTLFVSQISAGKESIDLSVADTMMFYSMSQSYVEHDQFSKRIEKFRDKRRLMYDYLIARGTEDELVWEAMKRKKDVADIIAENPRKAQRIATPEKS